MKQWKRYMIILAVLLLIVLGAQATMAEPISGITPDGFKWTYDEGDLAIKEYTGSASEVSVPSKIDGMTVTMIGGGAFRGTNVTKVSIPNTVRSIGSRAFYYCTSLSNVSIAPSVTWIGQGAFEQCTNLKGIIIPSSVTAISDYVFQDSGLENITIPNSVTSMGWGVFSDCPNLSSVILPESITMINRGFFCRCPELKDITVPDSVTSIEPYAFENCTNLNCITLPDSIEQIGQNAFFGCRNLENISIPKSVNEIGEESIGYYMDANFITRKVSSLNIHGYYGTIAEKYAKENDFAFTGSQSAISDIAMVSFEEEYACGYKGEEIKPAIEVSYKERGMATVLGDLVEGTDYRVSYNNNINAGTAKAIVTGINRYNGTIENDFTIYPVYLSSTVVTLSGNIYEFTGSEIKPTVTIVREFDNTALKEGIDYSVTYSNNTEIGTATVTITGKNNYRGIKAEHFCIIKPSSTNPISEENSPVYQKPSALNPITQQLESSQLKPAQETISIPQIPKSVKVKAKKKKVTISWKKIKKSKKTKALLAQIRGIEVQYSADPSFPSATSVKVPLGKKKTKLVLKGLLPKTAYYVRVRYTDGAGGFSNWSKVKAFRTK